MSAQCAAAEAHLDQLSSRMPVTRSGVEEAAIGAAELQAAFEREDHERRQALEEQERARESVRANLTPCSSVITSNIGARPSNAMHSKTALPWRTSSHRPRCASSGDIGPVHGHVERDRGDEDRVSWRL